MLMNMKRNELLGDPLDPFWKMGKFDDTCCEMRNCKRRENRGGPPDCGWPNLLGCPLPEL